MNIPVDFGPRSELERQYDLDPANFSSMHPREAYRIRMKRRAMEEAALAEAYHKIAGLKSIAICLPALLKPVPLQPKWKKDSRTPTELETA